MQYTKYYYIFPYYIAININFFDVSGELDTFSNQDVNQVDLH